MTMLGVFDLVARRLELVIEDAHLLGAGLGLLANHGVGDDNVAVADARTNPPRELDFELGDLEGLAN